MIGLEQRTSVLTPFEGRKIADHTIGTCYLSIVSKTDMLHNKVHIELDVTLAVS